MLKLLILLLFTFIIEINTQQEPTNCICSMEYNPIIGSDKKIYPNACTAGCAGVSVVGPCDKECNL